MNSLVTRFLERVCPEVFGEQLDSAVVASLRKQKVMLTLATLPLDLRLDEETRNWAQSEVERIRRLQALGREISDQSAGAGSVIKGSRYSALYPEGVYRFQGDLDVLFSDEAAYVRAIGRLEAGGFLQKASHLTQSRSGTRYASTILFTPQEGRESGPDSLFVELHLNGFPITPLSYLNMAEEGFILRSEAHKNAVALLGEFVSRAVEPFSHRDVLDTLLIFSTVSMEEIHALSETISDQYLWPSVKLLEQHLQKIGWNEVPAALDAVISDKRNVAIPAAFDVFEHQAKPFLERQGVSRIAFDQVLDGYGRINGPDGGTPRLTPFEIGGYFALGVPMAVRVLDPNAGTSMLDCCAVLAGPKSARRIVHQRFGEASPQGPEQSGLSTL